MYPLPHGQNTKSYYDDECISNRISYLDRLCLKQSGSFFYLNTKCNTL